MFVQSDRYDASLKMKLLYENSSRIDISVIYYLLYIIPLHVIYILICIVRYVYCYLSFVVSIAQFEQSQLFRLKEILLIITCRCAPYYFYVNFGNSLDYEQSDLR